MKKHIVCFGDSNTHGYCADPADCADHGERFNEEERWTCLLQKNLGNDYLVLEEGLSGRTMVFDDPIHGDMSGLAVIRPVLLTHAPVDLLIIMLGTNDTKERFGLSAENIAIALERLVRAAQAVLCWEENPPKIMVVSPPWIGEGLYTNRAGLSMGKGCPEKSRGLAAAFAETAELTGCYFMDAEGIAEFNQVDYMHLTRKGHAQLAEALTARVRDIFNG